MVEITNNFNRCRIAIYLEGFQTRVPNLRSSFDISSSRTSEDERTGWSCMETVAYNCTLFYGTWDIFGSVYSFFIHEYDRSYFPVLSFKDIINEDREPTTPFKLVTGKKTSVSHLRMLFPPCISQKYTENVDKKALNMHRQALKGFCSIFLKFHIIKKCILFTYQVQGR